MIQFDIYQSAALGVTALVAGGFLNNKIPLLRRLCIPSPVTGGVLFSLATLAVYCITGSEVTFDATVKDLCMMLFFTSVGFQADFSLLKRGGRALILMVLMVLVLIVCQNLLGVGLASLFGQSPLLGMAAGSIPMCGGHGTAGGFSGMLADMGLDGASSITMAAATFGLIAGSLIGSPLADSLIRRKALRCPPADAVSDVGVKSAADDASITEVNPAQLKDVSSDIASSTVAVFLLFVAMGVGTLVNKALSLLNISFPVYFGALIAAALIRNFTELVPRSPKLPVHHISQIGSVALNVFLGIAMISLKLWELASLALPLTCILFSQAVFIWAFARFVVFPLLGGNYDAAVMTGGLCGFGLGATPNAMANMNAVSERHGYSTLPFVVVPLVGVIFVDIINVMCITLFLNIIV